MVAICASACRCTRIWSRRRSRVAVEATITDGALQGEPISLSKGQLKLTLDARTANWRADAVVEGVPVTLKVQGHLGEKAGVNRRYRVEHRPMRCCKELGVDLPITLEGEVGVAATVTERRAERTAEIALDLTPTAIQVPPAELAEGIRPARHTDGLGHHSGRRPDRGDRIRAHERRSAGSGQPRGAARAIHAWRAAARSGAFGDSRAAVSLRQSDSAGYDVRIDARRSISLLGSIRWRPSGARTRRTSRRRSWCTCGRSG